ncbi:MAG: cytochrome P450, partial [Mycobacterium sp.]
SALLTSRDGGSLSDQELFWLSLTLLVAGNETTTNLIGLLLLASANHPEDYERLRSDPSLMMASLRKLCGGARRSSTSTAPLSATTP